MVGSKSVTSPARPSSPPVPFCSAGPDPAPAAGVWPRPPATRRAHPRTLACALTLALAICTAGPAAAQISTRVSSDAPVVNFRLPTFTDDGYRAWLVRGSEARLISAKEIDVNEFTMTVFTGDATERITTMILSPVARLLPEQQVVHGPGSIRVIDDEFEASGQDWRYAHQEKRVSIGKNVRVAFRAQLKDLLQ